MRTRLAILSLVCAAAVALSACGGGSPTSSTTTVAIGDPSPGGGAATTGSNSAAARAQAGKRARETRIAEARVRAAVRAQKRAHLKVLKTPAGTPGPTSLKGVRPGKTSPVPNCLAANRVGGAHEVAGGSWLGVVRPGQMIRVTGPYPHPNYAEVALHTLTLGGVGEVGGVYIVSARIDGKLGALVSSVAQCLQRKGGAGTGRGLTF